MFRMRTSARATMHHQRGEAVRVSVLFKIDSM